MPPVDPDVVAAIVRDVAAEIVLPRFRNLAAGDIREKKPGDLVTIADIEAEAALTRRLAPLLPGAVFVGEEAVSREERMLDRLQGKGAVWIVDPIDGTANFVNGCETFAVIVALVMDGITVMGWIFDPSSGRCTVAVQGGGTWRDGARLQIRPGASLDTMRGAIGHRLGRRMADAVGGIVNQGSIGHDYLSLTDNRLQFACFRRLRPWDHAAGVLMHAEAGGVSALLNGEAYRPRYSPEGILLAPDRRSWDLLRVLIAL